MNGFAHKQR